MATISHAFVSGKSDSADASLVRPSNWNASHIVNGTTGTNNFVLDTAPTIVSPLSLNSTSPSTTGAILSIYQNSSSPASLDYPGLIQTFGNNANAAKVQYGELSTRMYRTTAGAEVGAISGQVMTAGTMSDTLLGTETFILGYQNPPDNNFEYVFRGPSGFITYMFLESFDGGTTGPSLNLWHNSPSPAVGDMLGAVYTAGAVNYSGIQTFAENVTAAAQVGSLRFSLATAGVLAEKMRLTSTMMYLGQGFGVDLISQDSLQIAGNTDQSSGQCIARFTADTVSPFLYFIKSRNSTVGSHTAIASGDIIMDLEAWGDDGTIYTAQAGTIKIICDGTVASNSVPGRISFWTNPVSGTTALERMRIDNAGAVYFIGIGTTVSGANAFIDNGTTPVNSLLRVTSSLRYKTNITEIPAERLAAIEELQPVEYKSLASADDPDKRFVGFIAEEVAKIDPALVNLDAEGRPDGVIYDHVLLLQVAALNQRLKALEAKLH